MKNIKTVQLSLHARVHALLSEHGIVGEVTAETLVYRDGKQGVRICVDFPSELLDRMATAHENVMA